MTSKQRAYLKSLAMKIDPIYNIGKGSISPELVQGVRDALEARELIKIGVLQNCMDDPKELANVLAERTRSQIDQVIGQEFPHQKFCGNVVQFSVSLVVFHTIHFFFGPLKKRCVNLFTGCLFYSFAANCL